MAINRTFWLGSCAAAYVAAATPAQAQLKSFDIVAQPVESAIRLLGRQGDVQVAASSRVIRGRQAGAVRGAMTVEQAIGRLLAGTGLTARRTGARSWSVVAMSAVRQTAYPGPVVEQPKAVARAAAVTDNPPEDSDTGDIVVTAQKRVQTVMEVPQSLSVVGGATLERQQASSFTDYAQLVPGLTVQQANQGQARVILRGVNTGSVGSTVAVYLDETPFGSSTSLANAGTLAGDFDTFDIARVEVLRGPQGTLYGANALGGVLKFVTERPRTDSFEARGQAGVETVDGGGTGWQGNAVVNVPLGDAVAVRASGFYRNRAGFIDATGRQASNINDATSYGGRVSVLIEPTSTVSLRLSAVLQNIRANSPTSYEADPVNYRAVANDPLTRLPLNGRQVRAEYYPELHDTDYRLYNGTLDWDLGFATLTSATSYAELKLDQEIDRTSVLGPTINAVYGSAGSEPLGALLQSDVRQDKLTQEVRLASPKSDGLEWLVGAYYTRETARLLQRYFPFSIATQAVLSPRKALGGVTYDDFSQADISSQYKEYAAFGSVTLYLSPHFDITGGVRYSRNEQSVIQTVSGISLAAVGGRFQVTGKSAENVFTWSVAPHFKLSEHASLYARVAKGYRPGGPNVAVPGAGPDYPFQFNADTLVSYEAGFRAETADRRLGVAFSAFHLDWKDILVLGAYPTALGNVGANVNGGKARSQGVEATITLKPTRGLEVAFNAAYTDAKLVDATPPATGGKARDQLPYSPKWNIGLSADYQWSVFGDATAFVGANVHMIDDQFGDFNVPYQNAFRKRLKLDGFATADLRAGITRGKFSLSAYLKNITNTNGLTSIGEFGTRPAGNLSASPIRPRTVGATIGFAY